jgi:hypothetical protein
MEHHNMTDSSNCCVRNTFPYQNKTFQLSDNLEQQLLDVIMHRCEVIHDFVISGVWGLEVAKNVTDALNASSVFTEVASYEEVPAVVTPSGEILEEKYWKISITHH